MVVYYVKGIKQGLAIIKVSYPTYDGRETYVAIHVTDRDSDYENPLHVSSTLDYVTKYDTIHYDERTQNYPITVDVSVGSSNALALYVNGRRVDPGSILHLEKDGERYQQWSPRIPLKNGYNTVILTAADQGVTQTRVYQIRASKMTVTLENTTREGTEIYEGDEVKVHFTGLVNPLPKISRLYNPSQGQISYTTDLPFLTQLYGTSSQYDVTSSTVSFTATGAGDYSLHDGYLRVVGFGGSGWLETPTAQIPEYRGRPVKTVGGGGPNVPQSFMAYSFLPEVNFTVKENPDYHPVRVKATADKETYAPGETVTISIPDLDIAEIRSHHDFWDEIVDDSSAVPGSQYFKTTAITQSSVVYATDIPGLESVRTVEFVDVKKIVDNIREGKPILGADGKTEITVINNYREGAPVEGLEGLKTLTFKIPENTPSGTYKLKGGYVDVEYGPYWWVKYVTYCGGELEDVEITVAGEVAAEDKDDGTLKRISLDRCYAFIYDPRTPGGNTVPDAELYLDEEYVTQAQGVFNWTSINHVIRMDVYLGGKSAGATLKYPDADGETVTEFIKVNRNGKVQLPVLPLQLGDNQFTLTAHPQEGSTAPPTTYTFNVKRVVDERVAYFAELTGLSYQTLSANSEIAETPMGEGYSQKGVIISSGKDYTSDQPGKSYIEVGYSVQEILLSAQAKRPEPSFNLLYKAWLDNTKVTANGSSLEEPIKLDVGRNEIILHIDGGDFKTQADHIL